MVVTLTPLRSVFHVLHNVPGSSVFSAPRATATLPQRAPHNSHSNRPINVANGHRDVSQLIHCDPRGMFFVANSLLGPIGYTGIFPIQPVPAVSTTPGPCSGPTPRLQSTERLNTTRVSISARGPPERWCRGPTTRTHPHTISGAYRGRHYVRRLPPPNGERLRGGDWRGDRRFKSEHHRRRNGR